ncbi:peptidyl-prolyl cis-trans isomerase [Leuconostocaceae bacterium ESL0958]|nr:peptidyl-prolyl cis-trans isomerase [Leuconostocaceae bacterium ESL0958]
MKAKKIVWGALVLIVLGGGAYLATHASKTLATTSDGKITKEDYYKDFKKSSAGQQAFAQMVINKVLYKKYGNQVSDDDVTKAYNTQKSQYGDQFEKQLQQSGMSKSQFKQNLKDKLVMQAAVKANYSISKDQLKQAYDSYVPDTTISLISAKDQDTANQAVDALNNGTSWDDVYNQYSSKDSKASKSGQLPAFDSTDTNLDSEIRKAAFNQEAGHISDAFKGASSNTYYIVRTDKIADKPAQSKVEQKLKDKLTNDFINDSKNQEKIQKIIGKLLRKDDVDIKDSDLKNSLSGYLASGVNS